MKAFKPLMLILIFAVLLIGFSFAQEEQTSERERVRADRQARMQERVGRSGITGPRFGFGRINPARLVLAMRQRLELTDEQIKKLEGLEPEDPNAVQKARQALNDTQTALNAAVIATDEAKIKELCKKLGSATEKVSLMQSQEYKQIKKILTPGQYENLQKTLTQRPPVRRPGQMGTTGARQRQQERPTGQRGNRPDRRED